MDKENAAFASADDFISRHGVSEGAPTGEAITEDRDTLGTAGSGLTRITGFVEHVVFSNEDNGYTICEVSTDGEEGQQVLVTLVGTMPFISEGETVTAAGRWTDHPNFGRQFAVESYEKELPAGEAAILRYLSSRTVKGVGPASAKKIVDKFGADTFDVMSNHPEWLAEIPGISPEKARVIGESFDEQFGVRNVMMFCRDFVPPAIAVRIYKKWGNSSVDTIRSNPYLLCDEGYGLGFERVDRMAQTFGLAPDCRERVMAGIKYLLSYNAASNGHVYIPSDRIIPAAARLLGVDENNVGTALAALGDSGEIKVIRRDGRDCVYLRSYYEAEQYVAEKLDLLDRVCPRVPAGDIERFILAAETENGISYARAQKKAISLVLTSGVMVLTGGPGTGKTTVIRAVISLFENMRMKVQLAAPTGRAAKRISESTGREASTVHRMLEMAYTEGREAVYNKNEKDPIEADVVIIDEASMLDIMLTEALCRALRPGTRLLLIGDSDQLPSVGAGNVLGDIILSDRYNTVRLREIFRQASASLIITNAHCINQGDYPELDIKDNDFFFLQRDTAEEISSTVCSLCVSRLPKAYGDGIRSKLQVIAPSRKGTVGTVSLNAVLQRGLNPPSPDKREKKFRDIIFREGDKVMQIKNNYEIEWEKTEITGEVRKGQGVFNGDIGVIEQIRPGEESVVINFDGRITVYGYSDLEEIEHAYAITVHKSQGSEYPVVIIPLFQNSPRLMTRNLLYTAVTRAREMVIIVGQRGEVVQMVQNNRLCHRYTGLCEAIRNADRG